MAKYVMQEMNISYEEGKKKLYPRLIEVRQVDFDKLLDISAKPADCLKGPLPVCSVRWPSAWRC